MPGFQVIIKTGILCLCFIGLFIYALFYWATYLLKGGKHDYNG